jgi:hypothetical protein
MMFSFQTAEKSKYENRNTKSENRNAKFEPLRVSANATLQAASSIAADG